MAFPFFEVLQLVAPLLKGSADHPHTQEAQAIVTATAPLVAVPPTDQAALIAHQQTQIDTLTRMMNLMLKARQVSNP